MLQPCVQVRALMHHHGSLAACPPSVTARVVESEVETQSASTRRRHPYLAHLPLSSALALCEADLSGVLPADALAPFRAELDTRARRRATAARRQQAELARARAVEDAQAAERGPISPLELAAMPLPSEVRCL